MLLDRTHRTWLIVSLVVFAVSTGGYFVYAMQAPNGPHGGSIPGLLFGIVGTAMMLFAGLLAARKQVPTWRLGSAQFWLRGHIWLGLLSGPMVLYHAGFGWGGLLENALWITLGIVILSGLFGLAVQQVLPRYMTSRVSLETFVEQIPYQCQAMQFLADKLIAEQCGKLDVDGTPLIEVAESVAKQRKWLKRDSDFPKLMAGIYAASPVPIPEKPKPKKAVGKVSGKKPASKLARARAAGPTKKASAATTDEAEPAPSSAQAEASQTASPGKGESKLQRARARTGGPILESDASTADRLRAPIQADGGDRGPEVGTRSTPVASESAVEQKQPPIVIETIQKLLTTKYEFAPDLAGQMAANASTVPQTDRPGSEIREWLMHCTHCGYELHLPDPSFLGRLARCPDCRDKFTLEASAAVPVLAANSSSERGMSKLERARSQGAAADSPSGTSRSEKPKSRLESGRAQGGPQAPNDQSHDKTATPSAAQPAETPLSPLERARAQGAAQGKPATASKAKPPKADQPETGPPVSKVERARSQATPTSPVQASGKSSPAKSAIDRKILSKGKKQPVRKKQKATAAPIPRVDQLKTFYLESVRPYLALRQPHTESVRRLCKEAASDRAFARMRATLPSLLHPALVQLEDYCRERRQFTVLKRVHRWLHWWLVVHVPVSMALFVLLAAHIIMALRVVPLTF